MRNQSGAHVEQLDKPLLPTALRAGTEWPTVSRISRLDAGFRRHDEQWSFRRKPESRRIVIPAYAGIQIGRDESRLYAVPRPTVYRQEAGYRSAR